MIYELAYVSAVAPHVTNAEIDRILVTSRQRNSQTGVTGLLICDGHNFLQHLEGPQAAMSATLDRIVAHRAHYGLMVLDRRIAPSRAIPDSPMLYHAADVPHVRTDAAVEDLVQEILAWTPPSVRSVFANIMAFEAHETA